eukprot:3644941-Rhodomonas_salina.1
MEQNTRENRTSDLRAAEDNSRQEQTTLPEPLHDPPKHNNPPTPTTYHQPPGHQNTKNTYTPNRQTKNTNARRHGARRNLVKGVEEVDDDGVDVELVVVVRLAQRRQKVLHHRPVPQHLAQKEPRLHP